MLSKLPLANSGDWNAKSSSRESGRVQKVFFIMLEDIWLEFGNADKAIKMVLYFIKLCKLKENFFSLTGAKCNKILIYPPFQEFPSFVPTKNLDEAARENGVFLLSGINSPGLPLLAQSCFSVCHHLETRLAFDVKHSEFLRNYWYRKGLSAL